MKKASLIFASLLASLFASVSLHAQLITGATTSGPGNAGFTYDTSNPTTGTPDPYWAQFGVSGTATGSNLINVELGASNAITVSPITETGDAVAARTESTTGIYFEYLNSTTPGSLSNADGTSPQSSATIISSGNLSGGSAPAGAIAVQTGYSSGAPASGQALTFTITFNQAVVNASLDLLANDYDATSNFSFTFANGATTSLNDPVPPVHGGNDNEIYGLSFVDVPMGSVLTITDTITGTEAGLANTSITGIAFTSLNLTPNPLPSGEVLYYDANGATPGTSTSSTQNFTDSVWTVDPTGSLMTTGYVPGSDVVFSAGANGTGTQAVTVTDSEFVNSFTFKNGAVTLYGSGSPHLNIGTAGDLLPSGITVNSNDGATTFDSSLGTVTILTDQSWNNNSTQALNFNAGLSGTVNTITFAGTGTGAVYLNGNIVGNLNLMENSSTSTLYLNSESNSFTGTITVDGGSLVYQNQGSLNNNAITLSDGGLLESATDGLTATNDLLSNKITLGVGGGKVSAGILGSSSKNIVFSGTFTGGTGLSVVNGTFITQNDGTSNVGTLTITGGSRLLAGSGGIFGNNAVVNVYSTLDFGWKNYSGTLSNTINLQNGGAIENRGPGMTLSDVVFPTGTATVTLGADDVGGGSITLNGPGINLASGTTLTIIANANEYYPEYTSTDADPTLPANNNAIFNTNVTKTAIHLGEQITGNGNLVITPEEASIINVNTHDTVGYRLGYGSPIYLDGANNYSGTTTVDGATVYVGASGFGTSSVTLNSGSGGPYYDNVNQLELSGGTFTNPLTAGVGPSFMNLLAGSSAETISGPITIASAGATLIVQNSSSSRLSVGSVHINAAVGSQHGVNFEDYGGGITLTGTYASDYVDHNGASPVLNFGAGGENGTYTLASTSDFSGMQTNNPGGFGALELWSGTLNIATSAFSGQWLDVINNPGGTHAINLVGSQTVDMNIYTSNISTYSISQTAGGSSTWSGTQQIGYYDPTYSAAAGSRLNISGDIGGQTPDGITISGQGVVVLSSPTGNDYNRADLNEGHLVSADIKSGSTLLITNPANTAAFGKNSGQVRIEVGATLGGTGVATQAVDPQGNGAIIAPGEPGQASLGIAPAIGTLHLNGGIVATNGMTMNFRLNGAIYDTIDFGGSSIDFDNLITINMTGTPDLSADNDNGIYKILTDLNLQNAVQGDNLAFQINVPDGYKVLNYGVAQGSETTTGQDYFYVQLAAAAPTPEPSTYALLALGLLGLVAVQRFRKRAA